MRKSIFRVQLTGGYPPLDGVSKVFESCDAAAECYRNLLKEALSRGGYPGLIRFWEERLTTGGEYLKEDEDIRLVYLDDFSDLELKIVSDTSGVRSVEEIDRLPRIRKLSEVAYKADIGSWRLRFPGYKASGKVAAMRALRKHLYMSLRDAKEFVEFASSDRPSTISGLSMVVAESLLDDLAETTDYRVSIADVELLAASDDAAGIDSY
jgi:hypothetical protein